MMPFQGEIIQVYIGPVRGHEQDGRRPGLVVSNDVFLQETGLAVVCPITNTDYDYPLHVKLDERTKTTGNIMCEQIKTLDLKERNWKHIERVPSDLLERTVAIIQAMFDPILSYD